MEFKHWNSKNETSMNVLKLITKIKNVKKRNLLRGYSGKKHLNPSEIANLRYENGLYDCYIIGAALKGIGGILTEHNKKDKKSSKDLYTLTAFPPLSWKQEVYYTAGYINSRADESIAALELIRNLLDIDTKETISSLETILGYSEKYGASNYLSYKLAYLRSYKELNSDELSLIAKIEEQFRHREGSGFHFSALENINSRVSLFVAARRRVSALVGRVNGDLRKAISISNFIPTPVTIDDVSSFLLRSTESSLLDTIYSIIIIFNLHDEFTLPREEFRKILNPGILSLVEDAISEASNLKNDQMVTEYYASLNEEGDASLDLYRNAAAFLERPSIVNYRNKIDKVVGVRLLSEIAHPKVSLEDTFEKDKEIVLSKDGVDVHDALGIKLDTFYRTFVFLKMMSHQTSFLALSSEEINYIFENTLRLDTLLTEDEMRSINLISPDGSKNLITVLSLALFRKKSIDPDIDFDFRTDFISHVINNFDHSILSFINHLLEHSPAIASYIVVSLDEVTLEKMYGLIKNSSEASSIRRDILTSVGKKLNKIEYIIEAESITTREKVSTLQKYFDSSRIYVDSVSMKKWLDSNPTMATEQYRSLYNRSEAIISTTTKKISDEAELLFIQLINSGDYLVPQIAKDAFEQFCLNTEFGIQSYLGRRIRHNTLDGVTTDTVDAVLRKPEHRILLTNHSVQRLVDSWLISFKEIIDRLRREHLQFKSANSLFNAIIDVEDSATSENIRLLTNTLRSTGRSELLNDLVIAFCWKQITPQLDSAARFIRTTLLQEAKDSIDKHFSNTHNFGSSQIVAELHEAINEVFVKISDWFRVPDTGFISASIRELCQIILIDINRSNIEFFGNAAENKYTGISVHRLYDCLAVLLQNAHKHGEDNAVIKVYIDAVRSDNESVLENVTIDITSKVSAYNYENSKERIEEAINTVEAGSDMVTEGYTGIKKIKFITRVSEGQHTMRFSSNDEERELTLGFSIHAETTTEETNINKVILQ